MRLILHQVWQNRRRDACSEEVEGEDGEGVRGEGVLHCVVHIVVLGPVAQGQHKRRDAMVKKSHVEEEVGIAKGKRLPKFNHKVDV